MKSEARLKMEAHWKTNGLASEEEAWKWAKAKSKSEWGHWPFNCEPDCGWELWHEACAQLPNDPPPQWD